MSVSKNNSVSFLEKQCGNIEIERTRHLDVLRVSLEKVHASPCCLYGRGIVRDKSIIALGLRAGILE